MKAITATAGVGLLLLGLLALGALWAMMSPLRPELQPIDLPQPQQQRMNITSPAFFKPEGGTITIEVGYKNILYMGWEMTPLGCKYTATFTKGKQVQGINPLEPYDNQPCSPKVFLSFLESIADQIRTFFGEDAEDFIRMVGDFARAYIK